MSERLDMIIMLIQEEACERTGVKGTISKLYDVKLEVDLRIGALIKRIRDRDREETNKKGGE